MEDDETSFHIFLFKSLLEEMNKMCVELKP